MQVTSSVPSASSPAAAVGSEPAPDPPATVRLRISLDPGSDFEAQRQAVRASGADYDQRTRCWYLWLTGDLTSRAHQLARLFAAADRYGTAIVLEQ